MRGWVERASPKDRGEIEKGEGLTGPMSDRGVNSNTFSMGDFEGSTAGGLMSVAWSGILHTADVNPTIEDNSRQYHTEFNSKKTSIIQTKINK
jgi:hypothetical protein